MSVRQLVASTVLFARSLFTCWIKVNHHILAPVVSRVPLRTLLPILSHTVIVVLVKVTVQPSSQNLPMLTRLFVNVGIMWPSIVLLWRIGRFIVAVADDCVSCPDAVPTTLMGAVWSMFDTDASGIKKCPRAPVSALA